MPSPALQAADDAGLRYRVIRHGLVRSLAEAAQARGVTPADVIKTLVVRRGDGDFLFVLVPGDRTISGPRLRALPAASCLSLPDAAMAQDATGYERGTITPFGSLRPWPVIADARIAGREITLGAGEHGVAIAAAADDVIAILDATIADIAEPDNDRRTEEQEEEGAGDMTGGEHFAVEVADGRYVRVITAGPPDGLALVFHTGTPAGLLEYAPLVDAAAANGLRVVMYGRPGYGTSDPLPGRRVADAAADVSAVLDQIGAARCVTAGWSGGGPHALATAALLADRCAAAATIAGVAPYPAAGLDWLAGMAEENVTEFGAAMRGEAALKDILEATAAELS